MSKTLQLTLAGGNNCALVIFKLSIEQSLLLIPCYLKMADHFRCKSLTKKYFLNAMGSKITLSQLIVRFAITSHY